MGVSKFLKGQNKDIQIVGLQPKEGAKIPGIRRWPKEYLPKIFQVGCCSLKFSWWHQRHLSKHDGRFELFLFYICPVLQAERVDTIMDIGQREAEETMRALARVEVSVQSCSYLSYLQVAQRQWLVLSVLGAEPFSR